MLLYLQGFSSSTEILLDSVIHLLPTFKLKIYAKYLTFVL